jgi:hypothetical protein
LLKQHAQVRIRAKIGRRDVFHPVGVS